MFFLLTRKLATKLLYRQNCGRDEGPTDPPKSVGLETNHHLNVLAEPLLTCGAAQEIWKREK